MRLPSAKSSKRYTFRLCSEFHQTTLPDPQASIVLWFPLHNFHQRLLLKQRSSKHYTQNPSKNTGTGTYEGTHLGEGECRSSLKLGCILHNKYWIQCQQAPSHYQGQHQYKQCPSQDHPQGTACRNIHQQSSLSCLCIPTGHHLSYKVHTYKGRHNNLYQIHRRTHAQLGCNRCTGLCI